jgi:putative Holliday junction resolvase
VDYGEKRIGLAISDGLGITAQPLGVIENGGTKSVIDDISDIACEHDIATVVIGMPLNMDGTIGPKAREVLELRNLLADKLNIPVVTFDERLTTVEAERRLADAGVSRRKRGKKVDVVAAQIILQTYIDSRSTGEQS